MLFFTYEGSHTISFMSFEYYIITLLTFLSIYLIYKSRHKLKEGSNEKKVRIIMGLILLVNMIVYMVSKGFSGQYRYIEVLPIHLCYITNLAMSYMLLTNKKEMFKYLFYFLMIGPFPTILVPEIPFSYDRVGFWGAFITHHIILIFAFILIFVYDYKVTKSAKKKSVQLIVFIYFILYLFNTFFNTNYLYQSEFPEHIYKIFPFVKYLDYPLILTFGVLILFLFVADFAIDLINKKKIE